MTSSRALAFVALLTSLLLILGLLAYYFLVPKTQPNKSTSSQKTAKSTATKEALGKCTDIQLEPLVKNVRIVLFENKEKVLGDYEGQIKSLSFNDQKQKATFKLASGDKETKLFEVEESTMSVQNQATKEKLPFASLKDNLDVSFLFECFPSDSEQRPPQIKYYKISIK